MITITMRMAEQKCNLSNTHTADHSLRNTKICPSAYVSLQYTSARKHGR